MGYKVRIDIFEGPFDLLVYLIESARMSIYDIRVSSITTQYLAYVEEMKTLDVTVSSEFMVLAAELIQLKSEMLLPKMNKEGEAITEEDPRSGLVEKLLAYKRFKGIAEMLTVREEEGMALYTKPQEDISRYTNEPEERLTVEPKQFVSAFHMFLRKKKKEEEIRERYENLERHRVTSEDKVRFIESLFNADPNKKWLFTELIEDEADAYEIATAFSSLLEMVKQKKAEADQRRLFGDINVQVGKAYKEEKPQ